MSRLDPYILSTYYVVVLGTWYSTIPVGPSLPRPESVIRNYGSTPAVDQEPRDRIRSKGQEDKTKQNKTKQPRGSRRGGQDARQECCLNVQPLSQTFRLATWSSQVRLPLKRYEYVYGMPEMLQVGLMWVVVAVWNSIPQHSRGVLDLSMTVYTIIREVGCVYIIEVW